MMKKQMIISIKILLVFTVLTGIIYPFFITGIAQLVFPFRANGSLIQKNNLYVGSELIGQKFTGDEYFWSRPSAVDYNPLPSGGSNYGMTNQKLKDTTLAIRELFIQKNHLSENTDVPEEMIFSSASGLDPHISVMAAKLQVHRISKARSIDEKKIDELIDDLKEPRQFFFLGEARINVLLLNLELDKVSK